MSAATTAFSREYGRALEELVPLLSPERLRTLGRHNPGWGGPGFSVEGYLRPSEIRYVHALELAEAAGLDPSRIRVLDIGGFMGAFPLAMARIGCQVTISEKYSYYHGAFDEVRDKLKREGVTVWDEDLTEPLAELGEQRFELVTAMAIIEHLANSPKALLTTARALLAEHGRLIVEVPNLAYWPKRLEMLVGRSPHPPLRDVFTAETPYTGHHREYTWNELVQVLEWSGMSVDRMVAYNYTPPDVPFIWRPIYVWPTKLERCREVLMASSHRAPS